MLQLLDVQQYLASYSYHHPGASSPMGLYWSDLLSFWSGLWGHASKLYSAG